MCTYCYIHHRLYRCKLHLSVSKFDSCSGLLRAQSLITKIVFGLLREPQRSSPQSSIKPWKGRMISPRSSSKTLTSLSCMFDHNLHPYISDEASRTLKDINGFIRWQTARTFIRKMWTHGGDTDIIKRFNSRLDNALGLFQVLFISPSLGYKVSDNLIDISSRLKLIFNAN